MNPTINFNLKWTLIENNAKSPAFYIAELELTNTSEQPIQAPWRLYFNSVYLSTNTKSLTEGIAFEHLSGDFFRVTADLENHTIPAGESLKIRYQSFNYLLKNSHIPKRPYLVIHNNKEPIEPDSYSKTTIKLEDHVQALNGQTKANLLPTADHLFESNKSLHLLDQKNLVPIIPAPKVAKLGDGKIELNFPVSIGYDNEFQNENTQFIAQMNRHFENAIVETNDLSGSQIQLLFNEGITHEEGYSLKIQENGVQILARSGAGAWYGLQSLFALIHPDNLIKSTTKIDLPLIEIEDEPRFKLRGQFLDIARNFQRKEDLFKLIDLLSFYKLNTLQLHLANDEAWRLEIPGLSELTEYGSKRGHSEEESTIQWPYFGSGPDAENSTYGSGFLTREDFIEIIQYAHNRHVNVIPEMVTPGHMKASILAMEVRYRNMMELGNTEEASKYRLIHPADTSVYTSVQRYKMNTMDVCLESSFQFYTKVINEILLMYKEAGVPIKTFHTGGDEVPRGVWEGSPACQELIAKDASINSFNDLHYYFYQRLADLFDERNLQLAGWEEVGQRLEEIDGKLKHVPDPKLAQRGFRLHAWNAVVGWGGTDMAYQLANMGYEVVQSNSSNLYFDLAYDMHPDEPGLHWSGFVNLRSAWQMAPFNHFISNKLDINGNEVDANKLAKNHQALTELGKQNIVGLQGQLWSETINGPDMMFYYLLPKLLGLAERAWSPQAKWVSTKDGDRRNLEMEADWNEFANRVGQIEMNRLDHLNGGYTTRLPRAGITINNGYVFANVENPGLIIRYTLDGTEPTISSPLYENPVPVGEHKIFTAKVFTKSGNSGGNMSLKLN